jgi:SAM-dependent methyltransferase
MDAPDLSIPGRRRMGGGLPEGTMGLQFSSVELRLRAATTAPVACKICDGPSPLYGVADMNRPCLVGHNVPLSGIPIYYRRCPACGFLFTDAFDDWGHDEFKAHIYNDDYIVFDPDYKDRRPTANAALIAKFWSAHKGNMRVLDYGGGNDVFCAALRASGFKEAVTYDPMVPEHSHQPVGKFDLVTCFETLEHLPDPIAGISKIAELVADPGAVFYSTLTQPENVVVVRWAAQRPRVHLHQAGIDCSLDEVRLQDRVIQRWHPSFVPHAAGELGTEGRLGGPLITGFRDRATDHACRQRS